jgi:hypothetical protein
MSDAAGPGPLPNRPVVRDAEKANLDALLRLESVAEGFTSYFE